ncbi:MAG: carbohydrate binding domain-containing protein [Treponema sp.]|nr:carbohydrate binding domain-containing protein [Treponema sp.]
MTTLHIKTTADEKDISDLYGIFFEDLNHAADGGLYGELVRNRAFEFCARDNPSYTGLTAWEALHGSGEVALSVVTGSPVSKKNPHYLALDIIAPGDGTGFQNLGYNTGIPLKAGAAYRFSCYVRREQDFSSPLTVALTSADGERYASETFTAGKDWQRISLELTAPKTDSAARLAITATGTGRLYFDFVSLFPLDTFRGRENGLRRDLAERLEALHPRFVRFPGGCLVHDGALDATAHDAQYRWKNSVGRIEDRPSRRNNWGYNQSLGLGYYEYFLLCEDIGAKPLPVLPAGYDPHHKRACPMEAMDEFVQDALDLIEFANGGCSTEWGKYRAELGHPQPFNLEYLGVGNEEVGADFPPRFKLIRDAIKKAHPEIKVIGSSGPFSAGGEFERGWQSARTDGADLVDEHYYMAPEWLLAHTDRYGAYKAGDPKVFMGEYASWGNSWKNALYEAAYLTAAEKAPQVALACYAPLFCNVDYPNWKPDMIFFDNHRSYTTANYEVQKLFMHYTGDRLLACSADCDEAPVESPDDGGFSGEIAVQWIKADASFRDVTLTEYADAQDSAGTSRSLAAASVTEGQPYAELGATASRRWKLRLTARESSSKQGFRICFGSRRSEGSARRYYWEIGGWQNQDTTICKDLREGEPASCLEQSLFTVERDRDYVLELIVEGREIRAFIDGKQVHSTRDVLPVIQPLYWTATADESAVYVKAVNASDSPRALKAMFDGALAEGAVPADAGASVQAAGSLQGAGSALGAVAPAAIAQGTLLQAPLDAANSFENPAAVSPVAIEVPLTAGVLEYTLPPHSVAAFRIAR